MEAAGQKSGDVRSYRWCAVVPISGRAARPVRPDRDGVPGTGASARHLKQGRTHYAAPLGRCVRKQGAAAGSRLVARPPWGVRRVSAGGAVRDCARVLDRREGNLG
jgi:hypothetical protein